MAIGKNGSPASVLYGVDDQSVPPLAPVRAGTPIHLPYIFTFAPKGEPGKAYTCSGDGMKKYFGDITNLRNQFTTFNTPYIELFNSLANEMMVERILPDDAETPTFRLYAEVLTTDVQYTEDVEIAPGGLKIIWRAAQITPESGEFKNGKIFDGTGSTPSKIIPIVDLPGSYPGETLFGFKLSCPNAKSKQPLDVDIASEIGARLMELQFFEQTVPGVSPSIIRTIDGQTSTVFSFKKGAYYRPTRRDLDLDKVVMPSYRNMNPERGFLPEPGPVKDFYVYYDNLEKLLGDAYELVKSEDITDKYLVDIFTGLDVDGNSYNALTVDDGTEGGIVLTDDHVHYLEGGSNGTMNNETFDLLVRKKLIEFGEGDVNYLNILRYPGSFFWDSGFSVDTKDVIPNVIGRLKTTNVCLSTHIAGNDANDMATEESLKVALSAMVRAFPESTKYGTPAMRGTVVGHSMLLNNSQYKERVPVNYALARMVASYAGAGNGKFKPSARFSRGELTVINDGYDINLTYKLPQVYSSDWETGLISVRSYDQYSYHFPALYTVYKEDRSVCNNMLVAIVAANIELLATETWAEMTGVSDKTNAEIAKMVNDKLTLKFQDKYDGVVNLTPNAYFTPEDINNGYSITIDIDLYGGVMKTLFKTSIIAHRFVEG